MTTSMCLDDPWDYGYRPNRRTDAPPIDDDDDKPKVLVMPEYLRNIYERELGPDEYDSDDFIDHYANSEDRHVAFLLFEEYRLEPVGSHLTRQYRELSAPPYFKRDHPGDDLFLKKLGDTQVPWRTQLKYPKHADEPLIKDVVAFIIWRDTKHDDFWKELREMSPPDQDDSLYSHIIQVAASLVYFMYTQHNLFKIGHERKLDKQMDKIYTEAEKWCKKGTPIDEACQLLIQRTADKDEFSFITENNLADMLCFYATDIQYKNMNRPTTVKVKLHPQDKDQLFEDITKVVKEVESSPTELKADDLYTHWMITLLREEVTLLEEKLIHQAIADINPMTKRALLSEDALLGNLSALLRPLLVKAKDGMKQELLNVVQPLYELGELHQCKVCDAIAETIQVADLRRMSLGSRFIGRSHLIWAFYKLGYALPLEIRKMINIFDSDEDHPPYHIYMAALKLASQSGEKMQLDHFIYAVLNSKDIDFDGLKWTEFYQDFKDFQKALESMETEVEPKSTVTIRDCGLPDIFSYYSSSGSDVPSERTTDSDPSSSESSSEKSENSSTDTGDVEEKHHLRVQGYITLDNLESQILVE